MPSKAYADYLEVLLRDAEELVSAHGELRTGNVGRQWGLGALNRGVVVLSVSAWEAYVEELVKESLEVIRPVHAPMGVWPALNASSRSQVGRFNNPNPENVRTLFADAIGLMDVTASWCWQGADPPRVRERLAEALRQRHEIAHGVNSRPTVHNNYVVGLPVFFRRLGYCTDRAVREYLAQTLGASDLWPT
jgi:hypothetical protein